MAADVKTHLYEWSTTESSNLPVGSTVVSTNLDDNLRMIQKVVRDLSAPTTLAAAGTTDLGSKDETFITLTGTAATITALGTVSAGIYKWVIFNAAHTLTHNATSLILPTGANITAADKDVACFVSLGSGNWRCLTYERASGNPLANVSQLSDGSLLAPALSFVSDTDTGLYRIGTNNLGVAAGGVDVMDIKSDVMTIATTAASGTTTLTLEAAATSAGASVVAINASAVAGNGDITLTAADDVTIRGEGAVFLKDGSTTRVGVYTGNVALTGKLIANSGGTLSTGGGISMSGSSTCCEGALSSSTPTTISIGWGVTYTNVPVVVLSYVGSDVRITSKTVTTSGMDVTFSAAPADGDTLSWICLEP